MTPQKEKDSPMPHKLNLFFGIYGSARVPVLASSQSHAAEKLRLAGFGVSDRIAEGRLE